MNPTVPTNPPPTDPHLQQAILEYLKAEDEGTALDPETWLQRFPNEVRPQLLDFLKRHIPFSKPTRQQPPPTVLGPFDKYTDFQLLAAGGMGSIYRCTDKQLRRPLAMKVMHAHLLSQPDLVLRFFEEARTSARLQHHPAIAPVHEMGQTPNGQPFFTMKLIEGRTLGEAIADYRREPSWERLETLLRQFTIVCDSVDYAHNNGVLHRDLKPANIMVGAFNQVLVMDWGLAKAVNQRGTGVHQAVSASTVSNAALDTEVALFSEIGMVRGTLAFMPPEQADPSGPPLDEACDVFALGAVLCNILTGQPPYLSAKTELHDRQLDLLGQARSCATANVFTRLGQCKAPTPLVDLIRRCLDSQRQARPRRASEVGQVVAAYLQSLQLAERGKEIQQAQQIGAAAESRKRRLVQFVLGLLLLIAVGVGAAAVGVYEWRHRRQTEILHSDLEKLLGEAEQSLERDDLEAARSSLKEARHSRAVENAPAALLARLETVDQTIALLDHLRRCWDDSRLITPSGLNLAGAALEYEVAFRTYGYQRDEPKAFKERATASHASTGIAEALDHWAVCANDQPALRNQLLERAEEVQPGNNGWSAFRKSTNWADAQGVERIIAEADNALTGPRCALLALLLRMRNPQCLEQLNKFEKRFPKEYEIALEIGNLHLAQGIASKEPEREFLLAVSSYKQAKVLFDGSAAVWCNLGMAQQRLGLHTEAEEAFRKAIKVQPDNVQCHNMLGYELYARARWGEARSVYETAIGLARDNPGACLLGAMLHWEIGDQKEAERLARVVLKTMPEQPLVHFLLGAILMRQGRWDESVQELKEAKSRKTADSMMEPLQLIGEFAIPYINTTLRDADKRYPAVMNGTAKPHAAIPTDRYLLAEQMYLHDHPEAAAALFKEAFAAHGLLDTDTVKRGSSVLYTVHYHTLAARAALQASERASSADKKHEFRKLALDWLTADLKELEKLVNRETEAVKGKKDFSHLLLHLLLGNLESSLGDKWRQVDPRRHVEGWQLGADFQSVREADKLAQLPAQEQELWRGFWAQTEKLAARLKQENAPRD